MTNDTSGHCIFCLARGHNGAVSLVFRLGCQEQGCVKMLVFVPPKSRNLVHLLGSCKCPAQIIRQQAEFN